MQRGKAGGPAVLQEASGPAVVREGFWAVEGQEEADRGGPVGLGSGGSPHLREGGPGGDLLGHGVAAREGSWFAISPGVPAVQEGSWQPCGHSGGCRVLAEGGL